MRKKSNNCTKPIPCTSSIQPRLFSSEFFSYHLSLWWTLCAAGGRLTKQRWDQIDPFLSMCLSLFIGFLFTQDLRGEKWVTKQKLPEVSIACGLCCVQSVGVTIPTHCWSWSSLSSTDSLQEFLSLQIYRSVENWVSQRKMDKPKVPYDILWMYITEGDRLLQVV